MLYLYQISDAQTGELIRTVYGDFLAARCAFDDVLMDASVQFELDRSFQLNCVTTDHIVREATVCIEEINKDFLVNQISAVSRYIGLCRPWDSELPGKVEKLQHMLSVLKRIESMESDIAAASPVSGPTEVEFPDELAF